MVIHVVRAGESVYSIARDYGVNPVRLAQENGIGAQQVLVVGQTIVVQFPKTVHIVRAGQTLSSIARLYGVDVKTLWRNNRMLLGRSEVQSGELLVISYFNEPLGAFDAGGYAYPSIAPELLRSVLPYLTDVSPFTYGIDAEGHLLPLQDAWMRRAAAEYGVGALLHLSTVTEQGNFSSERAEMVLQSGEMQRRLAEEVLAAVKEGGFAGADVDFEYIPAEVRAQYATFIALLRELLAPEGYTVRVALAPKTSADQPGLLYEGHDYAALGAAADSVFLMTYEWGYTYGPPMAVAPLGNVRRVLDYALREIPAEKILLGIPNYGYDWPLPFVQGETRARSISNEQAVALAAQYGAEIQFDEAARAPRFRYWDGEGREHEVWFEDARSMAEKLRLAAEHGLRGVGYWNLDRPFAQNWPVLNALYRIR